MTWSSFLKMKTSLASVWTATKASYLLFLNFLISTKILRIFFFILLKGKFWKIKDCGQKLREFNKGNKSIFKYFLIYLFDSSCRNKLKKHNFLKQKLASYNNQWAHTMCVHAFRMGENSGVVVMIGDFKLITISFIAIIQW